MFQFTTTNVINSNKDLTTGKPLWSVQEAAGDKPASLHVKRVNKFIATNIVAIYKAEARDAENAKVNSRLFTGKWHSWRCIQTTYLCRTISSISKLIVC